MVCYTEGCIGRFDRASESEQYAGHSLLFRIWDLKDGFFLTNDVLLTREIGFICYRLGFYLPITSIKINWGKSAACILFPLSLCLTRDSWEQFKCPTYTHEVRGASQFKAERKNTSTYNWHPSNKVKTMLFIWHLNQIWF